MMKSFNKNILWKLYVYMENFENYLFIQFYDVINNFFKVCHSSRENYHCDIYFFRKQKIFHNIVFIVCDKGKLP